MLYGGGVVVCVLITLWEKHQFWFNIMAAVELLDFKAKCARVAEALRPSVSLCSYLLVVQQHLPTVLHGQVGLPLPLLPGVLVEGELPRHLGQTEQRVGVEFILQLLHTVQLLANKARGTKRLPLSFAGQFTDAFTL